MNESKWKDMGHNEILEGEGFDVSFLKRAPDGFPDAFYDGIETAIVFSDAYGRTNYLILKGDFREEYEPLVPLGRDACIAFYDAQPFEARSKWTEDYRASKGDANVPA